ncbi:hypothetical protein [Amycolatopsis panacis]|uniref:hypothetical protein n=1 Tax=Amycolatopsis panacis TaxID=2340917 RepID=UPI0013149A15|nr:hypothetical protein [Amycolatopsis panacis]
MTGAQRLPWPGWIGWTVRPSRFRQLVPRNRLNPTSRSSWQPPDRPGSLLRPEGLR